MLNLGKPTYSERYVYFYTGYDLAAIYDKKFDTYLINSLPHKFDMKLLEGKNVIIGRWATSMHRFVVMDFLNDVSDAMFEFFRTKKNKYLEELRIKFRSFQLFIEYLRKNNFKYFKDILRSPAYGHSIILIRRTLRDPKGVLAELRKSEEEDKLKGESANPLLA